MAKERPLRSVPSRLDKAHTPKTSSALMLGQTGRRSRNDSITIDDPVLIELRGARAFKTLERMALHPTIAGILELTRLLLQSADWKIEPGGEEERDVALSEFVADNISNLRPGWNSVVADAGEAFLWGFQLFETLFQRGDDGLVRWVAFMLYDPRTINRWHTEKQTGRLEGVVQMTDTSQVEIPAWKLLHLRHRPTAGRPEGRSLVRNAFLPWIDGNDLRRITKIGVRRELTGMTKMEVPIQIMGEGATPDDKATLAQMENLVREIERDIREGVVVPHEDLADGSTSGYRLSQITGAGRRAIDLVKLAQMNRQDIAISMLADHILLGHEAAGSWALGSSKTTTYAKAIGSYLWLIAEQMETTTVPVLQALNPQFDGAAVPIFRPGDIEELPLDELGKFVSDTGSGGFMTPDRRLEEALRRRAGLPLVEGEEEL